VLTVLKYVKRDLKVHAEFLADIVRDLPEESSRGGPRLMLAVLQYVIACYKIEPELCDFYPDDGIAAGVPM